MPAGIVDACKVPDPDIMDLDGEQSTLSRVNTCFVRTSTAQCSEQFPSLRYSGNDYPIVTSVSRSPPPPNILTVDGFYCTILTTSIRHLID